MFPAKSATDNTANVPLETSPVTDKSPLARTLPTTSSASCGASLLTPTREFESTCNTVTIVPELSVTFNCIEPPLDFEYNTVADNSVPMLKLKSLPRLIPPLDLIFNGALAVLVISLLKKFDEATGAPLITSASA